MSGEGDHRRSALVQASPTCVPPTACPILPDEQEKVITDILLVDQPIKRFVKPQEVGALVRHLCTDDAAAITGACLSVDGGWTAR